MTDEEFYLEHELHLAMEGKVLKTCPRCGYNTHGEACPECLINGKPVQLSGDTVIDDAFARTESGEDFDLEALLRSGKFAPVDPGNEMEEE